MQGMVAMMRAAFFLAAAALPWAVRGQNTNETTTTLVLTTTYTYEETTTVDPGAATTTAGSSGGNATTTTGSSGGGNVSATTTAAGSGATTTMGATTVPTTTIVSGGSGATTTMGATTVPTTTIVSGGGAPTTTAGGAAMTTTSGAGASSASETTTAATPSPQCASSGTMIDILGQSGKFTVYNEKKGSGKGIQVIMDALREVDAKGATVGASGKEKHSIQTFAAQNFQISKPEAVTAYGLKASKVTFNSEVGTIGLLTVDTYIFEESGLAGPPGEQWQVGCGDLKWNIKLSQWTWCGCAQGKTEELGEYIDLDISVKGQADIQTKKGGNRSLELGGGMTCELSNQVEVDNKWKQMPEGYPMVSTKGATTTFTFRFPKFNDSALYDPLITGVSPPDTTTTVAASPATTTMAASGGATTTTAAGGSGAKTTVPTSGATTTAAAGGATTTAAAGGAVPTVTMTATTTTTTAPPAKVEGSLDLTVSDCTAFSAQQGVVDSLAEGIASAAGSGISASDVAVTITCSRRLGASRRLAGTTATVSYVITVPPASSAPNAPAPVAPTTVADNIASETLTTFTAKITQALQANNVPTAGVSVAAVVAPVVVLPPSSTATTTITTVTTTTQVVGEPTGAGRRGSASPALAAATCLLAALASA